MKNLKKTIGISLLTMLTFMSATAQVGQNEQSQIQQHAIEGGVSDKEVEMFAEAFKGIQVESQKNKKEMILVIQEEEMDFQRFSEIQQKEQDPTQEVYVTDEEQEKLDKLMPKLQKIQEEAQSNMENEITESGLTIERYQEIAGLIQQSPKLQQKIQTLMQN